MANQQPGGIDAAARRQQLTTLHQNLNILREREAKHGGDAPLSLLNQIEDHRQAIDLVEQALAGELTNAELDEALAPLTLAIHQGQVVNIRTTDVRWLPLVIGLAAVVGVLAFLLWQFRPEPPPARMPAGTFNVAVAEFTMQDENGNPVSGDDGRDLADYLTQQLETSFSELELDKITTWKLWGPEQTGTVSGKTAEEREQATQTLAEKINATVLVYGTLTDRGEQSRFAPEFFVNHAAFPEAGEVTGPHRLGDDFPISHQDNIPALENQTLAGRANALVQITVGLVYLSKDNYDRAITYFQKAVDEERWRSNKGKEVAYLLLGNTYLRRGWQTKADGDLGAAVENFRSAVVLNPNYGRALLSAADALYLRATNSRPIDEALLALSLRNAEQTLRLPDQPDQFNIETKVHYHRAKIALARYAAGNTEQDWLAVAESEFKPVIADFEAGDLLVELLAGHAYAGLGFIAGQRGNTGQAVDYFEQAIAHATPLFKAEYLGWLSDVYAQQGELDKAINAMEQAVEYAENSPLDAQGVQEYQQKLDNLRDTQ